MNGVENNIITIKQDDFAELENELLNDPNDVNMPDPYKVSHGAHVSKPGD